MKAYDNGCCYSVSFNADDISGFADNWPCSGLRGVRRLWAQFDRRNGDLVDLMPSNLEERGADGSALLALISDGQEFAKGELGIMPDHLLRAAGLHPSQV